MYSDHLFTSLAYLAVGSDRQRAIYQMLGQLQIMQDLSDYHPILCGTIPLQIDLPDSDLDIICEVYHWENAYRHMVVEHYILQHCREDFRKRIIGLKESGIKTEPAFAHLLGLGPDPYVALLHMYDWDHEQWSSFFKEIEKHESVS